MSNRPRPAAPEPDLRALIPAQRPAPAPRRSPEPVPQQATGPDTDGRLGGFPDDLLPREHSPRVVRTALLAGITALLGVFALVVSSVVEASGPGSAAAAASAISAWRAEGGQAHLAAIVLDLGAITRAGADHDTAALGEACRDLRRDVAGARNGPPIPDGAAQASWAAGLDAGADAARHCVAGSSLADAGLLRATSAELGVMSSRLGAVANRLTELSAT